MNISIRVPNYLVFIKEDVLYINDKICNVNKDIIDEIVRYTINWENSYCDDLTLTGDLYYVEIGNKKYTFSNKYPANFNIFLEYLGELYDRICV
jgi:hypothetical protein